MLRKIIYIFAFLTFIFSNSLAETYYISNSGDDSNNGISPVFPLKTLEKANQIISKMKPGDAILFERGSIFYGQINISSSGNSNNPLFFGAYGKGNNPVISGSVPVTNWSKYNENIYSAEVKGVVKNLYSNGNQMTLARYPNSGYLTIDEPLSDPKKGFTDKQLNQSTGYWDGSVARIRTINWAYEYISIQKFYNSTIIFNNFTSYPVLKGWGYYLDNNFNELDTLGEWFSSDEKNGNSKLFFYPPSNGSGINSLNVQASIFDYGFFAYKEIKNIIVQDLDIKNQSVAGIHFAKNTSNVKIINCTFKNILQIGISIPSKSDFITIENCRFYDINGKAIYLPIIQNSNITDNIFLNIGMIPGYGTTGDPFPMCAIYMLGNKNNVSGNNINYVGHDAINCLGAENVVEKNVIKSCLLYLNDGGGIKCYGEYSKNSSWNNNFIFNVIGNIENTSGYNTSVALGIYLDHLVSNISIVNNTIVKSGFSGIGINNGFNNLVRNNVCFDNAVGINFFQNSQSENNLVLGNVISGKNTDQHSIDIKYLGSNLIPGRFDSNYYYNPENINSFRVNYRNVISEYNFDTWKSFVKSDGHSKFFTGIEVTFPKLFTNMSDDSVLIPLSFGYNFKDNNQDDVYGTLKLPPWSSKILFVNSDLSKLPEVTAAGRTVNFADSDAQSITSPSWYNLSAENLKSPVIIKAPDGFEVSIDDDSGFANTLSVNPVSGKVDRIIFVKMIQERNEGYRGFISNVSDNINCIVKVEVSSNK